MPFTAAIVEWFKTLGRDRHLEWTAAPDPGRALPPGTTADASYLGGGYEGVAEEPLPRPSTIPQVVFVDDNLVDRTVDQSATTDKIVLPPPPAPRGPNWHGLPPAIRDVLVERAKQDARFGVSNHDPMLWMTILGEEFGELCESVMHTRYGGHKAGPAQMRAEAIQVAAVALAMVEALDRGTWKWGSHVP